MVRSLWWFGKDTNQNPAVRDEDDKKYDIRGGPRGDCFLRFSRER